jgi:hypothetical protein
MKRIGIGSLLAAVIALAALGAASVAMAAGGPEYLACGKAAKVNGKLTGKYANNLCSQTSPTSEGKYERVAAKFPIKTKAKFGPTTIYLYNPIEHKAESEVPCKTGVESGMLTGPREGTVSFVYYGCEVPPTGKFPGPCTTPTEPPQKKLGTVVTEPLATKLVWLDEAESVPGILVQPVAPGGLYEEVRCLLGKVIVKQTGGLLAKLTPAGEVSKLFTVTFAASPTTGEPEFDSYWEGGIQTGVKLFSEVHAPNGIEFAAVPTSESSTIVQKGGKILIG